MTDDPCEGAGASQLLRGSAHSVVAVALNGAGGFAFWWVAAHLQRSSAVGSAQELFAALMAVTCLTSMGLPIAVARFCADGSVRAAAVFRWSLAYTALTSALGCALLVLVVPAELLSPLGDLSRVAAAAVLSVLVTGMSYAILVEVRLMALRRWGWVVGRVLMVVVIRLVLLGLPIGDAAPWLFALVTGVPAASGLIGAVALHLAAPGRAGWWRRQPPDGAAWLRYASVHYIGLLGAQGPMFLIPLVVAVTVDSQAYAPFYIAWAVTQTAFVVPHMLGQTFLVETAKSDADEPRHQQATLWLAVGSMLLVALGATAAGPLLSRSLGPGYGAVASLLPWLLAGCVPWALTSTVLAQARLHHEVSVVVAVTASFFVGTLGGVAFLAPGGGSLGAAQGWLVGNVLAACGALAAGRVPLLSAVRARPIELVTSRVELGSAAP